MRTASESISVLFDSGAPGLLLEGRDVRTTGRLALFSFLVNHTEHPKTATSTPPPNLHLMTTLSKRLLFPTESTMKKSSLFGFPRVRLRKLH